MAGIAPLDLPLPIPHVMWSPFRYSVGLFKLIRPDQSERVERSPSCKRILHESYEFIPLEKVYPWT